MNRHLRHRSFPVFAGAALAAAALASPVAWAQSAPLANVAEPGVYVVVQENDLFRVVLAT